MIALTRKSICGALHQTTYNGIPITMICTRFPSHFTHPDPRYHRHFNHKKKFGWTPDPDNPEKDTAG